MLADLDDCAELDGFLEMLLRVSDVMFTDGSSVADDFEDFILRYIAPLGVRVLHVCTLLSLCILWDPLEPQQLKFQQ